MGREPTGYPQIKDGVYLDGHSMQTRRQGSGYQELEHTADWELVVWAPDLSGVFEQAARGMYALSGTRLAAGARTRRMIELEAPDPESLLVSFLTELLYLGEEQSLGFDIFDIRIDGQKLNATVEGAPIATQEKEIKAVTYHNLKIRRDSRGYEVNVVFDV